MNIIKHVVADLEQIRSLLQERSERAGQWEDDPVTVEIGTEYVDDMIKRLGADIRALCHAIDPDRHSTAIRKEAVEASISENAL
jgi:hypothetical protein